MRLFVALSLPEAVRADLERLQHGLREARWVAPENFHLTLRFLGELGSGAAGDIDAALSVLRLPSFPLRLEGLGTFGEGRKLRALWAGVGESPELQRLQAKVERAVTSAGLSQEPRKFKPHVTLARFKRPIGQGQGVGEYLQEHSLFKSNSFEVTHFHLFSSSLGRQGAVYQPEASYPLVSESVLPSSNVLEVGL